MKYRIRFAMLAASLLLPTIAVAQEPAMADTIRQQARLFVEAIGSGNIDRFVDLFTPDSSFIYIDGGRIYPDRPALRNAGRGFFANIKTLSGAWSPSKVAILGPDAASFTGQLHVQGADNGQRHLADR